MSHIPATFLWMDTAELSDACSFSAIGIRGRLSFRLAGAVLFCRDATKEQLTALTWLRRDRNLARVDADNDAVGTDRTIRVALPGQHAMVTELLWDCSGA